MKIANYLSILFCTVVLFSAGVVFTSCDGEEPGNEWNYNNDDNNGRNSSADYYIKHSWGSGADEDWTWQPMSKSGSNYVYTGYWGGIGANINTEADDSYAEWYPESEIDGAYSCSVGDRIRFEYNPYSGSLSVKKLSSGSNGGNNGGGINGGNDEGDDGGGNNGGNNSDPVPSTPTGLTATQSGPKAYPYVLLDWDYSWDADHYVIYRSTSQYGSYSKIGTNKAASYSDENISNGKTYYYKVTAANSSGKESAYSDIASVTINTTVVNPPAIKTCKVTTGYNQITVKWTYENNSAYSKPDEVRIISSDPTWTGLTDVLSWTAASSKTSYTIRAADLIYNGDNKGEYTLWLQVRNSADGGVGAKIVWNVITNTGYVLGNLCGYATF